MFDGYYGEEEYGSEFGGVCHDELSLGRTVPDALRQYIELQGHLPPPVTVLRVQPPLVAPDSPPKPQTSGSARTRIVLPPGSRLSGALRFVLSPKWYRTRIEPVIADTHEEYFQELRAGRCGHARWIAVRGHLLAVQTLLSGIADCIRQLLAPSK